MKIVDTGTMTNRINVTADISPQLLGQYYVLEDGVIRQVGLFPGHDRTVLCCATPIGSEHPGYSADRMSKNLEEGQIYSLEDWRVVELIFESDMNTDAVLSDQPLDQGMMIDMPYELRIEEGSFSVLPENRNCAFFEAEMLRLTIAFRSLRYREIEYRDWSE